MDLPLIAKVRHNVQHDICACIFGVPDLAAFQHLGEEESMGGERRGGRSSQCTEERRRKGGSFCRPFANMLVLALDQNLWIP